MPNKRARKSKGGQRKQDQHDWAVSVKTPPDPPSLNQIRFQRRTYQVTLALTSGSATLTPASLSGIVPAASLFYPQVVQVWVPAVTATAVATASIEAVDGFKVVDTSAVGIGFAKCGIRLPHQQRIGAHNNTSTELLCTITGSSDPVVYLTVDICLKS